MLSLSESDLQRDLRMDDLRPCPPRPYTSDRPLGRHNFGSKSFGPPRPSQSILPDPSVHAKHNDEPIRHKWFRSHQPHSLSILYPPDGNLWHLIFCCGAVVPAFGKNHHRIQIHDYLDAAGLATADRLKA